MKKITFFTALVSCLTVFAAERPVTSAEMLELRMESREYFTFPETGWRFVYADRKEFASPDFDDSQWGTVRVNAPLTGKNKPVNMPDDYRKTRSSCWYRYTFELPADVPGNNFELRLGQISRGDQTFINGHLIGSFSFDKIVNKASSRERIYFSTGGKTILRPGKNVLAVRCKIGHLRGMHTGIVQLRLLPELQVIGRYAHRSPGVTAVYRQITGREELNQFQPGEKVFCRPELTVFSAQAELSGKLTLTLSAAGSTGALWQQKLPLTLKPGQYISPEPQQLPPLAAGNYEFSTVFTAQGRVLWQNKVKVQVAVAEKFDFPADKTLTRFDRSALPLTVGETSYGYFGPRHVSADKKLFYDYKRPDTRGNAVFLTTFGPSCRGALLGLSHVKPTPKKVGLKQVSSTIGGRFDHFGDMWILGEVMAAGKKESAVPGKDKTWWTGRQVTYSYPSGGSFTMTGSVLTPALVFETNDLPSMLFFTQNWWKTGTAQKIYVPEKGQLVPSASGRITSDYIVLSFEGNPAYKEFNVPMLMVFEKRPKMVKLIAKGVRVYFENNRSGRIYVMPLYGVTLQAPGMPGDAFARAEKWSKILPALPDRVTRTAQVDYESNRLLFQDKFHWDNGKKPAKTYLPVPPTLLLAKRGGMKLAASQQITDLELATMAGPFAAVRGGDTVTYALDGVLNFVREVRKTTDFAATEQAQAAGKRLEATVRQAAEMIAVHPWSFIAKKKGKGEIGGLQPFVSNLLIAAEYMPEDLRKQIHRDIVKELPLTIFNDDFRIPGKKPGTVVPINTKVTSPLSGKTFSALTRHHKDSGVDCPCWEALRLCIYEHAGRECNADELLKANWQQITYSYNPVINSHDWAYSASWDSYGGIRVGNGFQENTIFHAGLIAYARMTRRLGMREESDKAAYYALMQLIGTKSCASASSRDYLRRVRPVLASADHYADIERLENISPYHHLEINERTGFYHTLINLSYDNPGFIMTRLPEIMRPFVEVWGDYSARHIGFIRPNGKTRSHLEPPYVDQFLYVTDKPPFPVEKLIEMRLAPAVRSKLQLRDQLADDRAALEIHGKTVYRRLW